MDQQFIWPIRVYYEDTDAGGVVYHSRYLNFLERARTEWLRNLGFEQDALNNNMGILFVVRKLEIEFVQTARFNEKLLVYSKILEQRRVSLTFLQEIQREISDVKVTKARVQIACLDTMRHRPHPIPKVILEAIHHG